MKFMHLADLHLGRSLAEFDLYEDQDHLIGQFLDIAKVHRVEAVLISGDVYDRANPGDRAVHLLGKLLEQMEKAGLTVYMISGNHDSEEKLDFGRSFFARHHVHIYSVFDGTLHRESWTDSEGQRINVCLLPFIKASQVRQMYPEAQIDTYEDAVRTVLEAADIPEDQCNILLAHQFVAGRGEGQSPRLGGSESASVRNVGDVQRIGYDLFDAFDYVALGHIHSPQPAGRETVRYAGSPLKYSLSEAMDKKSVPVVEITGKGLVNIELVPLQPLRDLRHIRGTKEQLLKKENIEHPEDFIYVTLTDENIVDDAMGIFQQYYPNTVKIDYDNSHTRAGEIEELEDMEGQMTFSEVIRSFYAQMYGTEISEEELKIMEAAAKEAQIDETH